MYVCVGGGGGCITEVYKEEHCWKDINKCRTHCTYIVYILVLYVQSKLYIRGSRCSQIKNRHIAAVQYIAIENSLPNSNLLKAF